MGTAVVVHTAECKKYSAIGKMRRTKFFKRYPNYCKQCAAFGYEVWQDYFEEWCDAPCQYCLGKGLCPRCGTATMVSRTRILAPPTIDHFTHTREWETCSTCGWRGDDDYGDKYCVPQEWTCYCKEEE